MHNNLIICNGKIVLPDSVIGNGTIIIRDGKISEILNYIPDIEDFNDNFLMLNAGNKLVMPGLIDIHTDAMDVEICPRTSADFPIGIAFRELERKMAGCGITTAYHSMHIGYEIAEKGSKSKYTRKEVIEEVNKASKKHTIIHNRIHIRYEITGIHAYGLSEYLIKQGYVSLYSLMDHTPGQGQLSNENFINYAQRKGLDEQQAKIELQNLIQMPKIEGEQLTHLINLLKEHNIPVASHDDDSADKVMEMQRLGIDICEFPVNLESALTATSLGMPVVGGASNVLRGGSTGGNLNVMEAIKMGAINTLCSDYYPPAIIHSIFKIYNNKILNLNDSVNLATLNAAKAVKIDKYTGSLEKNKDADIIIVDLVDEIPLITHTIVKGRIVSQSVIFETVNKSCLQQLN